MPDIINYFVKDVPDAREGFVLTGSTEPLRSPGYQWKLNWVRAKAGGNYYRLESPPMEGWSCPAMYRYFRKTQKTLYVKVEAREK